MVHGQTRAIDGVAPGADEDGDGLPDTWEEEFGLLSIPAPLGAADGDPDNDGLSNLEEFQAGTHPRGVERRYFAEGAGGTFFKTRIVFFSADSSLVRVQVRVSRDDGVTVSEVLRMGPRSRHTVDASALAGGDATAFSTIIEADLPIVAERTMLWDDTGYGAHSDTAVLAPSPTWYFAEGSTAGDFHLYYLLQNPQTNTATVSVRFLRPFGQPPLEKNYTLPPSSRATIDVEAVDPALSSTDVSGVIVATVPIVAERAMYLDRPGQIFSAGHAAAGVTVPEFAWVLPEGATGTFFDLFILLMNPTAFLNLSRQEGTVSQARGRRVGLMCHGLDRNGLRIHVGHSQVHGPKRS